MFGRISQLLFYSLLATVLAAALDRIPAATAAEPLFHSPTLAEADEENSSPWQPPSEFSDADDFSDSIDAAGAAADDLVTSELPIELELEADESAANKKQRGSMGGPMGGGPPVGYRAFGEPTVEVDGQAATFEHWGQEINLGFPAWKEEPNLLILSTTIGNDLYDTAAVFPRNDVEFPESLWNISLGMLYFRDLADERKFGMGLDVTSASDVPFGALRDVSPSMFALYSIPRGDNAWSLSVFYSPLSEIPFPIPGVAYYWYASDQLQMNIGMPAQITWQPTEKFTFTASYMILHTITARGTWQFDENWSAYVAYENRNRSWFLHDRQRDDERLFAYDQAVLTGLNRKFLEKFEAELTAGYMFERFYFIGEDYDERNRDRIDIEPGLTVSAQIGVAW